jgi:hypothetical protein
MMAQEDAGGRGIGRIEGPVAGIAVAAGGDAVFVWTNASTNMTRVALPEELGRTAR